MRRMRITYCEESEEVPYILHLSESALGVAWVAGRRSEFPENWPFLLTIKHVKYHLASFVSRYSK